MPIIESGRVIEGSGTGTPLRFAGAPTSSTFAGVAVVGSVLIDTTNGKHYMCTATNGTTVTWTLTGGQVP